MSMNWHIAAISVVSSSICRVQLPEFTDLPIDWKTQCGVAQCGTI